jgi:membrane protein required for beta-lactamase induction
MVAFAPLLILGFGWLAAMRCAGDCVARKLNHSGDGSTFGRMSLGLFAFFILNVLLGTVCHGLGVIGLCVEIAVALMGLGATAVIAAGSGFGRKS